MQQPLQVEAHKKHLTFDKALRLQIRLNSISRAILSWMPTIPTPSSQSNPEATIYLATAQHTPRDDFIYDREQKKEFAKANAPTATTAARILSPKSAGIHSIKAFRSAIAAGTAEEFITQSTGTSSSTANSWQEEMTRVQENDRFILGAPTSATSRSSSDHRTNTKVTYVENKRARLPPKSCINTKTSFVVGINTAVPRKSYLNIIHQADDPKRSAIVKIFLILLRHGRVCFGPCLHRRVSIKIGGPAISFGIRNHLRLAQCRFCLSVTLQCSC